MIKMIVAYVQPHRLDAVRQALETLPNLPGMSIVDIRGFGREKVAEPRRSVAESVTDYTEHVRIEVIAGGALVERIVEIISKAARTGRRGDGKVFTLPIETALRIRTGEDGQAAV